MMIEVGAMLPMTVFDGLATRYECVARASPVDSSESLCSLAEIPLFSRRKYLI